MVADAGAPEARRGGGVSRAGVHGRSARRPEHGALLARAAAQPAAVRVVSQRESAHRRDEPADGECAAEYAGQQTRNRHAHLGVHQAAEGHDQHEDPGQGRRHA